MFIWATNFQGLTVGFARLPKLSRTYIAGHICLTENKIWVFHPRRGSAPSCFTQTRDLLLLLIYTTVSFDFGRCPISELTTHSPRMVNDQYHEHTPNSTQCDRAYEMQSCHFMLCHTICTIRDTCNISKTWIIIFSTYNLHPSKKYVSTQYFHT